MDFRFVDISLIPDLIGVTDRLFPKTTQVDQVVASEAASLGSQAPHNGEDIADLASDGIDYYLGANLHSRDEKLICDLVDNVTGQHRICGEEDEITVREEIACFIVGYVAYYIFNSYIVIRSAGNPLCNMNFMLCEFLAELADG